MANTFSFTGFDCEFYELPALPANFYNYEHYYVRYSSNKNKFTVYCFNRKVDCNMKFTSTLGRLTFDDGESVSYFSLEDGASSWVETVVSSGTVNFFTDYNIRDLSLTTIYSCDDFVDYKDVIYNKDLIVELEAHSSPLVLCNILEQQEDIPRDVFFEIFDVLPVLVVSLVAFWGIRKGIDLLSSLLRSS